MDESKLTNAEVQWLLRGIKHTENKRDIYELQCMVATTKSGAVIKTFDVSEFGGKLKFRFNFRCAQIASKKRVYHISLRFKKSNIQFVRLDVGRPHKIQLEIM